MGVQFPDETDIDYVLLEDYGAHSAQLLGVRLKVIMKHGGPHYAEKTLLRPLQLRCKRKIRRAHRLLRCHAWIAIGRSIKVWN
jgi:hypothetical protein